MTVAATLAHSAESYELFDVDNKNDMINVGDDPSLDITGNQITMEAWVRHDITPDFGERFGFLNHKGFSNGYRLLIEENSLNLSFQLPGSTDTLTSASTISANAWHHLVATYDGATMKIYIDGTKDVNEGAKTGNITSVSPDENDVWIGHGDQPVDKVWSFPWEGDIDEVRISTLARDADWIATEFNNQDTPGTFYSVGGEQSGSYVLTIFEVNYRSIGSGGQIYNTGQAALPIGTRTVTFSGATLPLNVGIGDKLILDPLGGNTETLFIISRDSASQVTVQQRAVLDHSTAEDYSIERAWDTLQNWENARDGNLVTEFRREVGVAYNDTPFASSIQFSGATTDADRFMWLTVAPVDRHTGIASTGAVLSPGAAGDAIIVQTDYTRVEWLEVTGWAGVSTDAVRIAADHTRFSHMIVHDGGDGASDGFRLAENGSRTARIENTITYNMGRACYNAYNDSGTFDLTFILENVTAYGCGWGGNFAAGGVNACQTTSNTTTVHARNVLAVGNLDGEGDADADFNINDATAACNATPSWGISDANITRDLTAPGPNSVTGIAAGGEFMDLTPTAEDLHLRAGANAIDAADFSLKIATDIDNQSRLGLSAWDVGADEFAATTAVRLTSFAAAPGDGEVVLEWRTASELDNLGFHLYRARSESGPFVRITERAIPGLGSSPVGARYHYRDTDLDNGITYYYELEDVETSGVTERHGPVAATPAAGAEPLTEPEVAETDTALIYGEPSDTRLLTRSRGPRRLTLTLDVGGFVGELTENGTLHLEVPQLTTEHGLPLRRLWVDVVAGRLAEIVSVRATGVTRFSGLRVSAGQGFELIATDSGVARLYRRPSATAGAPVEALQWARIVSVGYQGQQKRALVELSPFQRDPETGELQFAERLVVTLSFQKRDPSESTQKRLAKERNVVAQLGTTERGLYAVSFEDVFGRGRRRAVPATRLRLERQGEAVAYRLKPSRRKFGPGSKLYFVSDGAELNPYGHEAVYEVELGRPGLLMEDVALAPRGKPVPFLWHRIEHEQNRYYQAGLVDAPDVWLWELLFAPATKRFFFNVQGLFGETQDSSITVRLQGVSDLPEEPDHHLRAFVNGYLLGELWWDGKRAATLKGAIPPSVLHEGENVLELENVGDTRAAYSMVMLDGFDVIYPRAMTAGAGQASGVAPVDGVATLTGFPRGALVVDTTSEPPRWVSRVRRRKDRVRFRAEAARDYLTVARNAVRKPSIRIVRFSSVPSVLHAARSAEYLVVAPREFLAALEPLLELRREDGLAAAAVPVESIFDVFGHGETNPEALRDFLRDVYHPSLRYVVLVGDGHYDFKNYLGTGEPNWIPPLMVRTSSLWTASDPAYAFVHGDDELPDLALGRLPARSLEDVHGMVDKILAYERGAGTRERTIVLVAADADEAGDFERGAEELSATTLAGRSPRKIYLGKLGAAGARQQILESFDDGAGIVSYVGHGAINLWADENIFNTANIATLAPQSEQPFVLTLNCLNGYFHFPYFDSLAEALVKAEDKGAIAAISPSGLSLNEPAHTLHALLLRELLDGGHERLGDALLAAQDAYASTGSFPELLSIFHLFGDPALRLR